MQESIKSVISMRTIRIFCSHLSMVARRPADKNALGFPRRRGSFHSFSKCFQVFSGVSKGLSKDVQGFSKVLQGFPRVSQICFQRTSKGLQRVKKELVRFGSVRYFFWNWTGSVRFWEFVFPLRFGSWNFRVSAGSVRFASVDGGKLPRARQHTPRHVAQFRTRFGQDSRHAERALH